MRINGFQLYFQNLLNAMIRIEKVLRSYFPTCFCTIFYSSKMFPCVYQECDCYLMRIMILYSVSPKEKPNSIVSYKQMLVETINVQDTFCAVCRASLAKLLAFFFCSFSFLYSSARYSCGRDKISSSLCSIRDTTCCK